jgi:hypothetical protein
MVLSPLTGLAEKGGLLRELTPPANPIPGIAMRCPERCFATPCGAAQGSQRPVGAQEISRWRKPPERNARNLRKPRQGRQNRSKED